MSFVYSIYINIMSVGGEPRTQVNSHHRTIESLVLRYELGA